MDAVTKSMPGGKMADPPKGKRKLGEMPGAEGMESADAAPAAKTTPARRTAAVKKAPAKKAAAKKPAAKKAPAKKAAPKRGGTT